MSEWKPIGEDLRYDEVKSSFTKIPDGTIWIVWKGRHVWTWFFPSWMFHPSHPHRRHEDDF